MYRHNLPMLVVNQLRKLFIGNPKFRRVTAARELGIARTTVNLYVAEFKAISAQYPHKLKDFSFFMPVTGLGRPKTVLFKELQLLMPELIAKQSGLRLKASKAWQDYRAICPDGYSYSPFKCYFFSWCKAHDISLVSVKHIESIPDADMAVLKKWRLSNDHQHWQIAVVIEAAYSRKSLLKIAAKVECCFPTILRWLDIYVAKGLSGFDRKYTVNPQLLKTVEEKADNLVHLLQQNPGIYGVQRVSWTTTELAAVYTREFGTPMSQASVSKYLRRRGITYRQAKEVLTSPDPLYREKFQAIQHILENLTEREKFFSIDEYGPSSVRPKGGKVLALPGTRPSFPQVKKGKGWFIMTAALELATNQLSHFYSQTKDTGEMIKLIRLLLEEYGDQDKLYLSWDAASWHCSKKLLQFIDEINSSSFRLEHQTPVIALAPLPSCAQFLNVIESVFSGMSKSVIRNSDYASVEECKQAIDSYFAKRNAYFKANPEKAGKKIWGKERVKPVFDKANLCKGPYPSLRARHRKTS